MENYQIQRKIGSGNFAKVYLAKHAITNQEVRKASSKALARIATIILIASIQLSILAYRWL